MQSEDQVADNEGTQETVLLQYQSEEYDWTSKTLQDLETLNHASCKWLDEQGYKGKVVRRNANIQPRT
jgi:hypothetical protein